MKQVSVIISTYTADVSGVCSALYELGGMVVIHDPSGCNSTYNTHDEPRWYDQDSLVFISGLSEMDAIMGNDEKLIDDIVRAARQLHPQFIALVRTPVPLLTGVDFDAIRDILEEETGLPVFYFPTSGMHSYIQGVNMALDAVARHLVRPAEKQAEPFTLNLLGVTPLDFSVNGTLDSLQTFLRKEGFTVKSCFAMGSTPEEISHAGEAAVNLVVSSVGLKAAETLRERFGTPYVVGLPTGAFGKVVCEALRKAMETGENQLPFLDKLPEEWKEDSHTFLIGEAVIAQSFQWAAWLEYGIAIRPICPLPETDPALLGSGCLLAASEEEIRETLRTAERVIADPMYRPICPPSAAFVPLPHEAFSGRIYRKQIPNLMNPGFLAGDKENGMNGFEK